MYDLDDLIQLSALQHFAFCQRQRARDEIPTPACQLGVCRECKAC